MKEVVIPILGPYQLQYDVNNEVVKGIAGLDFPWIVGAIIFIIIIYSLFRMVGALIGK